MDGSKSFDFEFGDWDVEVSRLVEPLSGSTEWVEYKGTSVVRPIWGGLANLAELEIEGSTGRVQGLSLRLYRPELDLWDIWWANSRDGALSPAMTGRFDNHVGEFGNQEVIDGREVLVRFLFTEVQGDTFRFEQSFSEDQGASWEPNWMTRFSRAAHSID